MKPCSTVKESCSTFASGATQFVVQEAFETMWCESASYWSSLTPSTRVRSGSVAGAEITTFFAPASRCFCAPSRFVKKPVDSSTTSTPRSPQARSAWIALGEELDLLAGSVDDAVGELHVTGKRAEIRVVLEQVPHRLGVAEVVRGDDLEVRVALQRGAEEVASDPAEAVDPYPCRHAPPVSRCRRRV